MPSSPALQFAKAALALLAAAPAAAQSDDPGPWRLADAVGAPEWFEIKGTIRTRFENFDEQFRASGGGQQHGLFTRSLLEMTVRDEFLSATVELQDSRVYSGVSDTRLGGGDVNALEFLQAYVAGEFTGAFTPDDDLRVQLGRHTMDIGSRRLVARNRFRNTINAFTGFNAQWESPDGAAVRAFYTYPVRRLPGGQAAREDNEIEADEERPNQRFWGVDAVLPDVAGDTDAEFYYLGLDESDARDFDTADRSLTTLGTRWWRPSDPGTVYWELESAYQFGDRGDLDHAAWLQHVTLGYAFEDDMRSQVELLFDYASGDEDPSDGDSGRFDRLFGARRFEFGPTGIFGPFSLGNLMSPGVRYKGRPADRWQLMLAHRLHFLAEERDAWVNSGLVDPAGNSGDELGSLTEFRVRYDVVPRSFRLEFGAAYLAAGDFVDDAPNATTQGDTLYGYVQTVFTF